jgi:NADH-quinone oxidoreductase subunit H
MALDFDATAFLKWLIGSIVGALGGATTGLLVDVLAAAILSVVIILLVLTIVPGFVWGMRKIFADIGSRHGPTRVGPFGLLQTLADGVKMMTKETVVPARADRFGFLLAPYVAIVPMLIAFAPLPWSGGIILGNVGAGILLILAIGAISPLGEVLAGWSSNNKYSMYGGLRAAAMDVSYEIPMVISAIAVVLLAGTLNTQGIVAAQQPWWFFVLQPLGVIIFFVSAIAKIGVIPVDLPEAESELVAGYMTEYSGMQYGVFMLTLFANVFLMSAITVTLFFGGWSLLPPFGVAVVIMTFLAVISTRQPGTTVNVGPPALLGMVVGVTLAYLLGGASGSFASLVAALWGTDVSTHFFGPGSSPGNFLMVFGAAWDFLIPAVLVGAVVSILVTAAEGGTANDARVFPLAGIAALAFSLTLPLTLAPFLYVGIEGGLGFLLIEGLKLLILPILPLVALVLATVVAFGAAFALHGSLKDPVLAGAMALLPGLFIPLLMIPIGSFLLKSLFFSFLVFWLWFTLPRVRVDQFLRIGWRTMFPLSLVTLALAGVEAWLLRGGGL